MKNNMLFDTSLLGVLKDFNNGDQKICKEGFCCASTDKNILHIDHTTTSHEYPKGMILRVLHKFEQVFQLGKALDHGGDFGGVFRCGKSLVLLYPMLGLDTILNELKKGKTFTDREMVLLKIDNLGNVYGCYFADNVTVADAYILKTTGQTEGQSPEGYIAAVAAWLLFMPHDDLMTAEQDFIKQYFSSIMADILDGINVNLKRMNFMILAHNIYTLMEYTEKVSELYNVLIPFSFEPSCAGEVTFTDFRGQESIEEELVGRKTHELENSTAPTSNHPEPTGNHWDRLFGKYAVSDRKLTPYEESLVFHIPEYYQEPKNLLKYAEMYNKTFGKKLNMRFLMLCGPAGSGKTEWANMFSHLINRPKVTFNCDPEMTKDDLLTRFVPESGKPGSILHVPTELLQALEFGWVVEIAEPTLLNPAVMAAMNSLFDGIGKTVTPDGRIIKIHPETVVIMTTNLRYEGCNSMNQSVISRFIPVNLPYLEKKDLVERMRIYSGLNNKTVLGKMADVYYSAIEKAKELEIWDGSIDVRTMCQWATATAVNGKVWENGKDIFVAKCSLGDNSDIFDHCLEKSFSRDETITV